MNESQFNEILARVDKLAGTVADGAPALSETLLRETVARGWVGIAINGGFIVIAVIGLICAGLLFWRASKMDRAGGSGDGPAIIGGIVGLASLVVLGINVGDITNSARMIASPTLYLIERMFQ